MPDDEKALSIGEFREFKVELRRNLNAIEDSIKSLNKGQVDLALQLATNRAEAAEKAIAAQKETLMARAAEDSRVQAIDFKTKMIWTFAGALLMAGMSYFISRLK